MLSKPEDQRRRQLLTAAFDVFVRFGFRKTSMDEVARAAQVSRQALYLHFANKEELFRAAVQQVLDDALSAAIRIFAEGTAIEARLVRAFDAWFGWYLDRVMPQPTDLVEVGKTLVGELASDYEARFAEALTRAIRSSELLALYKPAGLNAQRLATTLLATARGLKQSSRSRLEFVEGISLAARVLCAHLPTVSV